MACEPAVEAQRHFLALLQRLPEGTVTEKQVNDDLALYNTSEGRGYAHGADRIEMARAPRLYGSYASPFSRSSAGGDLFSAKHRRNNREEMPSLNQIASFLTAVNANTAACVTENDYAVTLYRLLDRGYDLRARLSQEPEETDSYLRIRKKLAEVDGEAATLEDANALIKKQRIELAFWKEENAKLKAVPNALYGIRAAVRRLKATSDELKQTVRYQNLDSQDLITQYAKTYKTYSGVDLFSDAKVLERRGSGRGEEGASAGLSVVRQNELSKEMAEYLQQADPFRDAKTTLTTALTCLNDHVTSLTSRTPLLDDPKWETINWSDDVDDSPENLRKKKAIPSLQNLGKTIGVASVTDLPKHLSHLGSYSKVTPELGLVRATAGACRQLSTVFGLIQTLCKIRLDLTAELEEAKAKIIQMHVELKETEMKSGKGGGSGGGGRGGAAAPDRKGIAAVVQRTLENGRARVRELSRFAPLTSPAAISMGERADGTSTNDSPILASSDDLGASVNMGGGVSLAALGLGGLGLDSSASGNGGNNNSKKKQRNNSTSGMGVASISTPPGNGENPNSPLGGGSVGSGAGFGGPSPTVFVGKGATTRQAQQRQNDATNNTNRSPSTATGGARRVLGGAAPKLKAVGGGGGAAAKSLGGGIHRGEATLIIDEDPLRAPPPLSAPHHDDREGRTVKGPQFMKESEATTSAGTQTDESGLDSPTARAFRETFDDASAATGKGNNISEGTGPSVPFGVLVELEVQRRLFAITKGKLGMDNAKVEQTLQVLFQNKDSENEFAHLLVSENGVMLGSSGLSAQPAETTSPHDPHLSLLHSSSNNVGLASRKDLNALLGYTKRISPRSQQDANGPPIETSDPNSIITITFKKEQKRIKRQERRDRQKALVAKELNIDRSELDARLAAAKNKRVGSSADERKTSVSSLLSSSSSSSSTSSIDSSSSYSSEDEAFDNVLSGLRESDTMAPAKISADKRKRQRAKNRKRAEKRKDSADSGEEAGEEERFLETMGWARRLDPSTNKIVTVIHCRVAGGQEGEEREKGSQNSGLTKTTASLADESLPHSSSFVIVPESVVEAQRHLMLKGGKGKGKRRHRGGGGTQANAEREKEIKEAPVADVADPQPSQGEENNTKDDRPASESSIHAGADNNTPRRRLSSITPKATLAHNSSSAAAGSSLSNPQPLTPARLPPIAPLLTLVPVTLTPLGVARRLSSAAAGDTAGGEEGNEGKEKTQSSVPIYTPEEALKKAMTMMRGARVGSGGLNETNPFVSERGRSLLPLSSAASSSVGGGKSRRSIALSASPEKAVTVTAATAVITGAPSGSSSPSAGGGGSAAASSSFQQQQPPPASGAISEHDKRAIELNEARQMLCALKSNSSANPFAGGNYEVRASHQLVFKPAVQVASAPKKMQGYDGALPLRRIGDAL